MKPVQKNARSRMICLLMGVALLSMPFSHAVAADTKNKQDRAAQRRLQQMQQKFEQDKAALEQEKAALKEQMEAKLAAAQKALAKQRREMNRLQAEYSEKDTRLVSCHREAESAQFAARNELAATQQKLGDTMQNLQQSDVFNKQLKGEKSRLEVALAEQKTEVHTCQARNTSLINMFMGMANKYEKAELEYVEPWTGLKGVEVENRFQDSRDQAEAQLYKPRK